FGEGDVPAKPCLPVRSIANRSTGSRRDASQAIRLGCVSIVAESADWLPNCDGKESALALSMLHVVWNELGVYEEAFLKRETNAPFLVGDDGNYLRDEATHQPLVLDSFDRTLKTAGDPAVSDPSIRWMCEVGGRQARTAFELFRLRLASYSPEMMEPL